MKKLLTVLTLIAVSSSVMAATATSKWQANINSKLNTLNQKEQALTNKVEAAKAENAKKQAEAKAKQEAQKKALEQKRAEQQAKLDKAKSDLKAKQDAQKAKIEKAKKDAEAQRAANRKAVNDTKNNIKTTVDNQKNFLKNLAK